MATSYHSLKIYAQPTIEPQKGFKSKTLYILKLHIKINLMLWSQMLCPTSRSLIKEAMTLADFPILSGVSPSTDHHQ